jgi:hypothetical protein
MNAGVNPWIVVSSLLLSRAWRRVAASGEHRSWWMYHAYLAAEDLESTLAAIAMVGCNAVGSDIGVGVGWPVRGIIHRPVHVHLWLRMMVHQR